MSQHDLVVDNGSGITVRLDLNQALQALGTGQAGTTAPAPAYPCQSWADLSTGLMKKRNSANTAWLADGKYDTPTAGGVPVGGAAGAILMKNSAADGDMVWTGTGGFLPTTGGTISGNLGITGTLFVQGTISSATPMQVNVAAGAYAIYYGSVSGARQFYWGVNPAGNWVIVDNTGGAQRFVITPAGAASFANNLTVSGNFNTNSINGTVIAASTNIQMIAPSGVAAWYYSTVTGVRQWLFGTNTDGAYYIYDGSAGATRMTINTAGLVAIAQSLNVAANCTVGGALSAGSFSVSGALNVGSLAASSRIDVSVASGQNAIVWLTSAGQRQWYVGSMNNGQFYITDQSGGVVRMTIDTAGNISTSAAAGFAVGTGGIDCAGTGVAYTGLAAAGYAFSSSGRALTFYVNGASTGVWTFNAPSDERLKENIGPTVGDALAELCEVKLISFDLLPPDSEPESPSTHYDYGFSAQNVRGIIGEAVFETSIAPMSDDPQARPLGDAEAAETTRLALDIMPLLARCVGAIQQLNSRITNLEGFLK
jgi:hypothetical protein